ncbi:hypothetical protein EUX98_g9555 [Antrodiella citrinella]|uniref:Uncharacterized protein n=1 Tax=Antrodiella citrinella TaxID=2447956 RepID=A0A4S4LRQ7_9APHY|nr:hypothetical protein EUX98_g9555 [Antrodiella citrinella]
MHLPLERSPLVELPAPWVKLDKLTLANVVIFAGSLDAGGGFVYFFSIFSEIRSITLRNGFDARFDACIPDPECSDSRDSDVFTKVSETDLDLPTPPAAPPTVHDHCPPLPPLSTQLRVHKLSFKSGPRWVFWNTVRQDLQRCIALGDLDVIRIEDIDVGRVRRVVDELGRRAACIRVDIEMQDEGRVEPDSLVLSGNPRLRKLRLVVRSDAVYPYLNAEKLQFIAETLGSIPTNQLADLSVETNLHASSSYQSIPSDTLKRVEETLTSLDLDKEMESMRLDIGVCSVNASHQRKVSPEDRALMLSMQDSVKLHMPRLFRRDAVHIILADRTEYAQCSLTPERQNVPQTALSSFEYRAPSLSIFLSFA